MATQRLSAADELAKARLMAKSTRTPQERRAMAEARMKPLPKTSKDDESMALLPKGSGRQLAERKRETKKLGNY